jgi:hypothetical protein
MVWNILPAVGPGHWVVRVLPAGGDIVRADDRGSQDFDPESLWIDDV